MGTRADAPFVSLDDLRARVVLSKDELRALARLGALNAFCGHRRAALWQIERDPLPDDLFALAERIDGFVVGATPLRAMDAIERMQADYRSQRLTTGPHPMKLMREQLPELWRANEVGTARHGAEITIGGAVICRQRPGTARGHVFISVEDETGVANAVVSPDLFEAERLTITQERFLCITGPVQTERGLPLVRATRIERLVCLQVDGTYSHDFH